MSKDQDYDPEFLECLGTIRIKPGDTVVFKMKDKEVSGAQIEHVKRNINKLGAEYQCKVLVLESDMEIGVLRGEG